MTAAARRDVSVCVTPYATGVMANRWLWCFGATPVQAVRKVLGNIGLDASAVKSMRTARGDTVLLSTTTPALPLAFVQEDLAPAEVADALERIRAGALS